MLVLISVFYWGIYLQAGSEIVCNGLLVQYSVAKHSLAGSMMFSFVAEIFDSIDTTKPAILSGAREAGEWGDDWYEIFTIQSFLMMHNQSPRSDTCNPRDVSGWGNSKSMRIINQLMSDLISPSGSAGGGCIVVSSGSTVDQDRARLTTHYSAHRILLL